jgi:hypothetical protein
VYLKLLKLTGFWNHKETHQQYKTETIEAPIIYGRKKRVNEIPELKIAIISVSLANFEVNQITDKKILKENSQNKS